MVAQGLTPRSVTEKFKAMQMVDVHLPTSDGRELVLGAASSVGVTDREIKMGEQLVLDLANGGEDYFHC